MSARIDLWLEIQYNCAEMGPFKPFVDPRLVTPDGLKMMRTSTKHPDQSGDEKSTLVGRDTWAESQASRAFSWGHGTQACCETVGMFLSEDMPQTSQ